VSSMFNYLSERYSAKANASRLDDAL